MRPPFTGAARIAGVVGSPIHQTLSPLIHNAWIQVCEMDALYAPFHPSADGFRGLIDGLRRTNVRGLNITAPFKAEAFALAHHRDAASEAAGAANLLLFDPDGGVSAANFDGVGLLAALAEQAPGWTPYQGAVVVLGAGGAASGAVAALHSAGAEIRVVNRTRSRADVLAASTPGATVWGWRDLSDALENAALLINATSALTEDDAFAPSLGAARPDMVVMDMTYRPLHTPLLKRAMAEGLVVVDGLAMLIGQARPSFQALFGRPPPIEIDVRDLALEALGPSEAR